MSEKRLSSCAPCIAKNSDLPSRYNGSARDHMLLKKFEAYFPEEVRNGTVPEGSMLIFKNGSWSLMEHPTLKPKNADRLYLMFDKKTKTICVEQE